MWSPLRRALKIPVGAEARHSFLERPKIRKEHSRTPVLSVGYLHQTRVPEKFSGQEAAYGVTCIAPVACASSMSAWTTISIPMCSSPRSRLLSPSTKLCSSCSTDTPGAPITSPKLCRKLQIKSRSPPAAFSSSGGNSLWKPSAGGGNSGLTRAEGSLGPFPSVPDVYLRMIQH